MRGAFLISRTIFNSDLWDDIIKFRIFFYLIGRACFSEEGTEIAGIKLERGQYLRSLRQIQDDLAYREGRGNRIKLYPLTTIQRKIKSLVNEERIEVKSTEYGTLFTILNYQQYQALENYKISPMEQQWNSNGTATEQQWNNNNNANNANNANKEIPPISPKPEKVKYAEFVTMTNAEYEKLVSTHGEEFTKRCIEVLDNYKGAKGKKYKNDYRAILNWVVDRVQEEQRKHPKLRNQTGKPQMFDNKQQSSVSDEEYERILQKARRLQEGVGNR